jgi:hypothetical protein
MRSSFQPSFPAKVIILTAEGSRRALLHMAHVNRHLLLHPATFFVYTVWVKGPPKPDPVKRRPPTTRRFYLTEPTVPSGLYIRHIPRPRQRC